MGNSRGSAWEPKGIRWGSKGDPRQNRGIRPFRGCWRLSSEGIQRNQVSLGDVPLGRGWSRGCFRRGGQIESQTLRRLSQTTEGFCFRFEWVGGRVRKAVLPPWDQASGSGTPPSSTLMQFCQRTDVREPLFFFSYQIFVGTEGVTPSL